MQMSGISGEQEISSDLESKCSTLRREIAEVIKELTDPKVSDKCDSPNPAA